MGLGLAVVLYKTKFFGVASALFILWVLVVPNRHSDLAVGGRSLILLSLNLFVFLLSLNLGRCVELNFG